MDCYTCHQGQIRHRELDNCLEAIWANHLVTATVVQAQNQQLIEICNPNPNIAARDEGHLFPNEFLDPKKV